MNDRQIEIFLAAADSLNLTQAAQSLYISQPAVTYQLKALEKELGVLLFDRRKNKLELTDAGKVFRDDVGHIHESFQKLFAKMAGFSDKRTPFFFGCSPFMITSDTEFFTYLFSKIQNDHPSLSLETTFMEHGSDLAMLRSERADLIFASLDENNPPSKKYGTKWILEAKTSVMVPKNSSLAKKKSLSIEDIVNLPIYVSKDEKTYLPGAMQELRMRAQQELDIKEVDSFDLLPVFVSKNNGISLSSQSWESPLVAFVPLEGASSLSIHLVWLKAKETRTLLSIVDTMVKAYEIRLEKNDEAALEWLND